QAVLDNLAGLLARQHATAVVVIGYGPAERVTPVMAGIFEVFTAHQIRVHDALRVSDGRYFSYLCHNPSCCPPDRVPFDPASNPLAAQATLAGLQALPDRATLTAQVAPLSGAARAAMRLATERAQTQLMSLMTTAGAGHSATRPAASSARQDRMADLDA